MTSQLPNGAVYTVAARSNAGASSASVAYSVTQSSATHVTIESTVTDYSDGSGALFDGYGSVLYGTRQVTLKVTRDYEEHAYNATYERASAWESQTMTAVPQTVGAGTSQKGGDSSTRSVSETYAANTLRVRYRTGAGTPEAHGMTVTPPPVEIDLCPTTADWVVPGSVQFTWMGVVYVDFEGVLYRDRTDTDPGIASGTLDYSTGIATMTDYVASGDPRAFVLDSLWTRNGRPEPIASIAFNTAMAPVRPAGLVLSVVDVAGNQLTGTADMDGIVDEQHIYGRIDYESGLVELQFGDYVMASSLTDDDKTEWWYDAEDIGVDGRIWRPWPVLGDTLRYNVVAYSYLPLPADIIGVDAVRLPQDGRVPIFRPGDVALVMHAAETAPQTVVNGGVIDCGRTRLAWVRVIDATGATVTGGYTLDRATGQVSFADVSGIEMPVRVSHTVADLRLVKDAQISGVIEFTRPLSHAFPAHETLIASCVLHGDRRARVSAVWDQVTWSGAWLDTIEGAAATATLDTIAHPVEVTNAGAVTERWALRWTSTNNVELIGQTRGLVYAGPFTGDIAPLNPATRNPDGSGGVPYLRIPLAANGGGWSAGNTVRINTVGATADMYIARAIQQSEEPAGDGEDGCEIYCLGNIDRP